MMKIASRLILAAAALSASVPVLAHHSFAMFDSRRTLTVNAVVTEFQWTNPHCWLEIDVPAGQQAQTSFRHLSLEMTGLGGLRSAGWTPRTLKFGDAVQISYHPMRDGTAAGQLLSVKLANGTVLKGQ